LLVPLPLPFPEIPPTRSLTLEANNVFQ